MFKVFRQNQVQFSMYEIGLLINFINQSTNQPLTFISTIFRFFLLVFGIVFRSIITNSQLENHIH